MHVAHDGKGMSEFTFVDGEIDSYCAFEVSDSPVGKINTMVCRYESEVIVFQQVLGHTLCDDGECGACIYQCWYLSSFEVYLDVAVDDVY